MRVPAILPALLMVTTAAGQSWQSSDQRASIQQQLQSVHKQQAALKDTGWFTKNSAVTYSAHLDSLPSMAPDSAPAVDDPACAELPSDMRRELAASAGERVGVDPALILAVMRQESGFHPCAVSSKGALGLMQLMPANLDGLFVADPFDAEQNVFGGARLLRQLLDRYDNDAALALSAYNAGPARVTSEIPNIAETKAYVAAILANPALQSLIAPPQPPPAPVTDAPAPIDPP